MEIRAPIDLGFGVLIESFTREPTGMVLRHPATDGEGADCWLAVQFATPAAVAARAPDVVLHEVESWEPLSIIQSLECHACGHHGRIRGGVWVPA